MTPEQEIILLKEKIRRIEEFMANFSFSDRYIFAKYLQFSDAVNMQFDTRTGSQIGTALNQKIGFWGVAPVVQPSSTGEASGVNEGAGVALTHTATFTGNFGTKAYTLSDVVKHLKTIGDLKKDS